MSESLLSRFGSLVLAAAGRRLAGLGVEETSGATLERPATREHGDLAANIALVAAKAAKRPPRELAAELIEEMEQDAELMGLCDSLQIAGPGFINFFFSGEALNRACREALAAGEGFGSGTAAGPERILLEFVSANPTGPLHAGHARYAAYGDSLRRILAFAGHEVTTEFYINDYGSQMELFGRSLAARYAELGGRESEFPENGYQGAYTIKIAETISGEIGDAMLDDASPAPGAAAVAAFKQKGCELVLEQMRAALERFRVAFDSWFSEAGLYPAEAAAAIEQLRGQGEAYESEGALWLRTTSYGDDKDRVLVRKNGEPTYFASDIAYHRDKLERGYDRLINIWGADHHGYVLRMKAAFEALAHDPYRLEIIIGQLVNIMEMGERRQMSKRAGTMVTLTELMDSIGVDAARFFLVDRSHDSTLDLDVEKARQQSEENPVYYVQYAHARIASILKKAADEMAGEGDSAAYAELEPSERELALKLLELPRVAGAAAESREPHKLTTYARELAAIFHAFYHNCPVIRAEPDAAAFRLELCRLTKGTIKTCLKLTGVSAPESM